VLLSKYRAKYWNTMGYVRYTLFERHREAEDLDAAITYLGKALRATPADHRDHVKILMNLGSVLLTRYEHSGVAADLDAAVEADQQAVQAAPAGHPRRAGFLSNLGSALRYRFERDGVAADLDAAVEAGQQAVQAAPLDHPDRAGSLSNLARALYSRFERDGVAADLDAAVEASQQAVQAIPVGHPYRAKYLSNLGTALLMRFERGGVAADLDAAVEIGQQAVRAITVGHPDRVKCLSNLGSALHARFERGGVAADLDAAVEIGQQTVQAIPVGHPDRAGYLSSLALALHSRFEREGAAADLDAAITYYPEAVQAIPVGHPDRAKCLSNLGAALYSRYERGGVASDLDAAIEAGQQAVQVTPASHPGRNPRLSNLGILLATRFERDGAAADLDAAITHYGEIVQATPVGHPDRAVCLSNLGIALRIRFEHGGVAADLDAAIEAGQQAVHAIPASHPDRAGCLSSLGLALATRFDRNGIAGDRDAALEMLEEAASMSVAAPSARIGAGRVAASLIAETDPGRAAGLLKAAVRLLPQTTPRFLERGDQQYAIGRFPRLASDAAALALSDPAVPELQRPAQALRLLEAARGVLLSQALSTRSDLSELRERYPELAVRFAELRDLLDRPSPAIGTQPADLPGVSGTDALQRVVQERRQASEEFTELVARIRSLEGFGTFALPPSADQLEEQAQQGPIVVLNVSVHRSDALLLTSSGVTSHPLPGLDQATVVDQVIAFHQALETIVTGAPLGWDNAQKTLMDVLAWLWDNAVGPVLDILGYQKPPAPGQSWPRLWWVPGGLLSLLPIHAAGHHTSPLDPGRRSVIDRVISSYTPTVGALAHARTVAATTAPATSRSLIVAMPTTPGLPGEGRLTSVLAEADLLRTCLPQPVLLTEPPADSDTPADQVPTKANVLEHLPGCAIAHFACHGYADPADPSQSRLLLHDHRHDPLTVAALASLALDDVRLAYLSACSTARMTDGSVLDEAIHLASAFQLAGFPRVIGTLWEISDNTAVEIARHFYSALFSPDGTLDPGRAADALHHATRSQRDRLPTTPYLWAAHIHVGA
jgi:tetratricopeptide (TPR) repeat protein